MAFIEKRGKKRYTVRVFLGRHPKTGKRDFHIKTIHGSQADAEKYARDKERERDLGLLAAPTDLTVKDYLDRWLRESAKNKLAANTFEQYSEIIARYIDEPIGLLYLKNLSPLDIQSLYTEMGKKVSSRTVRYLLTIRVYDLRHSCATILFEAGGHPKLVAERVGHSSIVLTLDTYSHLVPGLQEQITEDMAAHFFRTQSPNSHPKQKGRENAAFKLLILLAGRQGFEPR